jgi:hypothetical protein
MEGAAAVVFAAVIPITSWDIGKLKLVFLCIHQVVLCSQLLWCAILLLDDDFQLFNSGFEFKYSEQDAEDAFGQNYRLVQIA